MVKSVPPAAPTGYGSAISSTAIEALAMAIGTVAGEIAARIIEERSSGQATPRYATPKDNPLGSARAFREAAAAGAFRTFRRGKESAAMWSDVEAWMIQQPPPARRQKAAPDGNLSLHQELLMSARPPSRRRRAA